EEVRLRPGAAGARARDLADLRDVAAPVAHHVRRRVADLRAAAGGTHLAGAQHGTARARGHGLSLAPQGLALPPGGSMIRRRILGAALLLPVHALAQTCGLVTPRQTEGPFFRPSSPQRITLIEAGSKASTLRVTGQVLGRDCKPIKGVLLDFWHADEH